MKKSIKILMMFTLIVISSYCNLQAQNATYEQVIHKKIKGRITSYIANNGENYNIGDTLIIGTPLNGEEYSHIIQNAGIAYYPLTPIASGSEVIIKKMRIHSKMLSVYTTKPNGFIYGLYIANMDGAIKNGELIDYGFISTEQALKQLRIIKDKFDLNIITKDEYDLKRIELLKYIK